MRISPAFLPFEVVLRRKPAEPLRWKLRDGMIAVAVIAILTGLGLQLAGLGDRSRRFRALADHYAVLAAGSWFIGGEARKGVIQGGTKGEGSAAPVDRRLAADRALHLAALQEASDQSYRRAAYYEILVKKYRHAQAHPLLPVWPDPPKP